MKNGYELAWRLYQPVPEGLSREALKDTRSLLQQAEVLTTGPSLAAVDHELSQAKAVENILQRLRVRLVEADK